MPKIISSSTTKKFNFMASVTSSTLIFMALNGCSIWDCCKALQPANSTLSVNSKHDLGKSSKWRRCCSSVVNGAKSSFEYSDRVQVQITELDDGFHKDVNLLLSEKHLHKDVTLSLNLIAESFYLIIMWYFKSSFPMELKYFFYWFSIVREKWFTLIFLFLLACGMTKQLL